MTEKRLIDTFIQISTLHDLELAIPPEMLNRLGGGEEGKKLYFYLMIRLSSFAPDPGKFDKESWDELVLVHPITQAHFPDELGATMLEIALQSGLMKEVDGEPGWYMTNPALRPLIERVLESK